MLNVDKLKVKLQKNGYKTNGPVILWFEADGQMDKLRGISTELAALITAQSNATVVLPNPTTIQKFQNNRLIETLKNPQGFPCYH